MPSPLVSAHIEAERRLRVATGEAVRRAWLALPHYNESDVAPFLELVVPTIDAAKRQSIALTEAYLSQFLGDSPVGVDAELVLSRIRDGATDNEVYRRPFVDVWSGLKRGVAWTDAVAAGLDRAVGLAQTDVQLAMRETLRVAATVY